MLRLGWVGVRAIHVTHECDVLKGGGGSTAWGVTLLCKNKGGGGEVQQKYDVRNNMGYETLPCLCVVGWRDVGK